MRSAVRSAARSAVRSAVISRIANTPAFRLLSIFSAGEQGALFDPRDTSASFLTSAGTTNVAADGDPRGLMLDGRYGLERGVELVVNGAFDADVSGWDVVLGTPEWLDGAGQITVDNSNGRLEQLIYLDPGRYEVLIDIVSTSAGADPYIRLGDGDADYTGLGNDPAPVGKFRKIVTVTQNALRVAALPRVVGESIRIDNVSVREIPGYHASQPTSAYRPLYRADGMLDSDADDYMTVSLPAIAAATVAIARPAGTQITYPVDLSTGSYRLDGDGYGWLIVDRELTAKEKKGVTAEFDKRAEL